MSTALLGTVKPVPQRGRRGPITKIAVYFARGGDADALKRRLASIITFSRSGMITAEIEDATARPGVVSEPGR